MTTISSNTIKGVCTLSVSALTAAVPVVVSAATKASTTNKTLADLINLIIGYLNQALLLLMGVAIVMFVYYVIKYFIKADADRAGAGQYVMWSIIGFFVILSFWGLVSILQGTFGLNNETYQPRSWQSFTNLFPGGSRSSGSGPSTDPFEYSGGQNSI